MNIYASVYENDTLLVSYKLGVGDWIPLPEKYGNLRIELFTEKLLTRYMTIWIFKKGLGHSMHTIYYLNSKPTTYIPLTPTFPKYKVEIQEEVDNLLNMMFKDIKRDSFYENIYWAIPS